MDAILAISIIISIIVTYLILKSDKFLKLKLLIYKIFWIKKFQGETRTHKILSFGARLFMVFYLFSFIMLLLSNIFTRDLPGLVSVAIGLIVYPLMYRIVMGFQRIIHRI